MENYTKDSEIKEFTGKLIEEPFVNKAGRVTPNMGDLFFEIDKKKYFVRLDEGNILRADFEKFLNQTIKIKGYLTSGLWDTSDPRMQSRMGEYIVVLEIVKESEIKESEIKELKIKEYIGELIEVPYVNKAGREIAGVGDLFFKTLGKEYFLKLAEGDMLREDFKKHYNKTITTKGYITTGLWDTYNPEMQSRTGDYMVILEIL